MSTWKKIVDAHAKVYVKQEKKKATSILLSLRYIQYTDKTTTTTKYIYITKFVIYPDIIMCVCRDKHDFFCILYEFYLR